MGSFKEGVHLNKPQHRTYDNNTHDQRRVLKPSLNLEEGLKKSGLLPVEDVVKDKIDKFQEYNLEHLNLEKLSLEDSHISLLTQTLRFSQNLKKLSLNNNFITNLGVKELLADLGPNVEEIDLSHNLINSNSLREFLQVIKQSQSKLSLIKLVGSNIKKTNQNKAQKLFSQYHAQIIFD